MLFNADSAIFQLYHGENKLIFNDQHAELDFYNASSLNISPWVDMLLHSDTLF